MEDRKMDNLANAEKEPSILNNLKKLENVIAGISNMLFTAEEKPKVVAEVQPKSVIGEIKERIEKASLKLIEVRKELVKIK